MSRIPSLTIALATVLLCAAGVALANEPHPAMQARAQAASIDANTFIVGHPASPTNGAASSANGAHPAVLVKARSMSIDANTFIVGHPASPANGAGELGVTRQAAR